MKDLPNCSELLVYFVTGEEAPHANWDSFLRNNLLKQYNVLPGSIEVGPASD